MSVKWMELNMAVNDLYGENVDAYETWFVENNLTFKSEVNAIQLLLPNETRNGIELRSGNRSFCRTAWYQIWIGTFTNHG